MTGTADASAGIDDSGPLISALLSPPRRPSGLVSRTRLLLRLVRDEQSSECELFSREDMGAMLGITTETASRTIAEFKRQSLLVETSPNHFLLDIRNLERIAED